MKKNIAGILNTLLLLFSMSFTVLVSADEKTLTVASIVKHLFAKSNEKNIELQWQIDASQQLKNIRLYRKDYALPIRREKPVKGTLVNSGQLIAELKPVQKAFIDTNVTAGYYYYYRLELVNEDGSKGKLSSPAIASLKDKVPPQPPLLQAIKALDDKQFKISWQASDSIDVVAYRIYRATLKGQPQIIKIVNLKTHTNKNFSEILQHSGQVEFEYRYAIAAVDAAGNVSAQSDFKFLRMPDHIAPRTPSLLTANQKQKNIILEWLPNRENDLQGYRVYRRENKAGSLFKPLHKTLLKKTQFIDKHIKPLRAYVYRVAAVDDFANESKASRGVLIRSTSFNSSLAAPKNVSITVSKKHYPVLRWQPVYNNSPIKYVVQRSAGDQFINVSGLLNKAKFIDHKVESGNAYQYRVQAVNQQGRYSLPSTAVLWTGGKK